MADMETSVVISAQTDDLQSGMEAAANSVQAATEGMKANFVEFQRRGPASPGADKRGCGADRIDDRCTAEQGRQASRGRLATG